jgi:hypothetical protein
MKHQSIIEHLRENAAVFKNLFQTVSDKQAPWKPDVESELKKVSR